MFQEIHVVKKGLQIHCMVDHEIDVHFDRKMYFLDNWQKLLELHVVFRIMHMNIGMLEVFTCLLHIGNKYIV